ncbi:MAG: hypothetical protein HQ557_15360 [Bacteroidetes bacterium]|nr:hypothetical protein [Bacteroidota bacterium]
MNNSGLFSTIYIQDIKDTIQLDDPAKGRMATLSQTWRTKEQKDVGSIWDSFFKQAVSYLEFVPPTHAEKGYIYPLYEDFNFSKSISALCIVPPGSDINSTDVGSFYPAKLMFFLKKHNLNWGILSDGASWRLYSAKSARPFEDYVELALDKTLENADEAEYGLFETFFHKESFISQESDDSDDEKKSYYKCRLDLNKEASEETLEKKVKSPFLSQVDEVLQYICNGFIYDANTSGDEYSEEERGEIFESAVKLIYRALFLFYAEARKLLPSDPNKSDLYNSHSINSLCLEAHKFKWGERRDNEGYDLWKHLKGLISAVNDGDSEYGIMGYNGGLFDDDRERFLGEHQLRNDFISRALYLLAYVEPFNNERDEEYAIPYKDLEVRHLGELYESILEYSVQLSDADRIRRRTKKGVSILLASEITRQAGDSVIKKGEFYFGESALERKQTGSYYTPESLVHFLNEKSIIGPLKETFDKNYRFRFKELIDEVNNGIDPGTSRGAAQAAAILVERFVNDVVLKYKVCDPAMGSGHFLVNASNQMTALIIELLGEIPQVDGLNIDFSSTPNVWRRLITRHCIYGVDLNPLAVNLAKLSLWLNCFASDHKLTFLDHHVRCGNSLIGIRSLDQLASIPKRKKDGKRVDNKQKLLFDFDNFSTILSQASEGIASINELKEDDTDNQKAVFQDSYSSIEKMAPLADLYTAYLMDPFIKKEDYRDIFESLAQGRAIEDSFNLALPGVYERVKVLGKSHHYYHWPLEFPDVFGSGAVGGFSATVGNPPWDVLQPNTQEFYINYDPNFRKYNKQEALKVSKQLCESNANIEENWNKYQCSFKEASVYFKEPQSYRALQKGKIDLYKAFLERFFALLSNSGRMGIIVPSGIYTDQGCQPSREMFFDKSEIDFLYCFENRWPTVFNAVDGRFKFVTFSTKKGNKTDSFKCAFMEHDPERLKLIDTDALKMSVEQVKKFSPDTLSIMEFKSQRDIDITTKIYGDWPLLGEKIEGTWNVRFRQELNMTSDSHLFKTTPTDHPLYEGKMIWHFDSKFEKPRYWLDRDEVVKALGDNAWEAEHYRVGFRDIAASTNERTLVSTIIPNTWHGHNMASLKPFENKGKCESPFTFIIFIIFSSFLIDYLIRQKVTNHMSHYYMKTIPYLSSTKSETAISFIMPKALRLICTNKLFSELWNVNYKNTWKSNDFWYSSSVPIDDYGPIHEQEIRKLLRDEASNLTSEWGTHCGVHDRLPDRRDTGDRAQLRAEIDAYVAHLYGITKDDFAYILDTFPVLKKKEMKAFGEFMSKRKCLEEFDRIGKVLDAGGGLS